MRRTILPSPEELRSQAEVGRREPEEPRRNRRASHLVSIRALHTRHRRKGNGREIRLRPRETGEQDR